MAEHVFNIKIRKDNHPSLNEDLEKLTIKDASKVLVKEKKVIESLFEDPSTKEQKMHIQYPDGMLLHESIILSFLIL